jgi:hypothetical protein
MSVDCHSWKNVDVELFMLAETTSAMLRYRTRFWSLRLGLAAGDPYYALYSRTEYWSLGSAACHVRSMPRAKKVPGHNRSRNLAGRLQILCLNEPTAIALMRDLEKPRYSLDCGSYVSSELGRFLPISPVEIAKSPML